MYKVLIVDDEQVERDALQMILNKEFPDLTVQQAVNGRTAIELADEWRPDLVLMDIKMPGVDGLQAVQAIREKHEQTKFIMVTAYDTFEYAQKAIRLQVNDYLLKPSKSSIIVETIGHALDAITLARAEADLRVRDNERLNRLMPIVEADLVTQLLFDHVHEVHLSEMLAMLGTVVSSEAFAMLLLMSPNPSELDSVSQFAAGDYYSAVKQKIRQYGNGFVGAMSGRQIPIIVFRDPDTSYRAQAASLVRQLLHLQHRSDVTDVFVGVGEAYGSLSNIRLSYQEALLASADRTLPARHRFFSDVPAVSERENLAVTKLLEKAMIDRVRRGEWSDVHGIINELLEHYESCGAEFRLSQQRMWEALWAVSRVAEELGCDADLPNLSFQASGYKELRTEAAGVVDKYAKAITAERDRLEPGAISRIKQFIVENAHRDISLEMIAEQVNLNPYYISKMFKDQMGVNYIDFLTDCRMEKAKSLMARPEISLKEIAYEVGYHDPNYFSRVFKKTTGVVPTDYRKSMLGK
jgi:two-component system response regulator YesN